MKHQWNRFATAAVAAATLAVPMGSVAQDTPWLVRVRAVYLDMANKDSTGLDLSLNKKVIPEVDISYFYTPTLAMELVLSYPQKHDIRAGGTEIGSLKHLPPTLTLQYHVSDLGAFKPYVGAGLNYTRFSSVKFDPAVRAALQPSVDKNSFGFAVQAGIDVAVAKGVSLNFDVKKVQIRTDVKSAGTKVGEFRADPWLIGAGVGWRF